jgi:enoyl-CoA hydratase
MQHPHLVVTQEGVATWIRINRSEKMNAMSVSMWRALGELLEDLARQDPDRPVVLRGSGERAFSAGSDLEEFHRMTIDQVNDVFLTMEETIGLVERVPMPVIAAVNGYAMGSALELCCACDLQIAAESARFGMPVARLGIMLSPEFAKRIVALIGPNHTKNLLFSARTLDAPAAAQIGLVTEVVPDAQLDEAAAILAEGISRMSPRAVTAAKRSVFSALPAPGPGGEPPYSIDPSDFREGVAAFLEKRAPRFGAAPG